MMGYSNPLFLSSGTFVLALAGWALGGQLGAAVGAALGLAVLVVPWWRQPLWLWARHFLRRAEPIVVVAPTTATNDLSAGGVRYQDGVAIAAIQIYGKPHIPTLFTGSTAVETGNVIRPSRLVPMMRQSLGLKLESISVVSFGSRRRSTGDYARVYDTLVGPPPYAGVRETWLILRIRVAENAEALGCRTTVGAATIAAAQRIAAGLRCEGIRAKVATAADIIEFETRLGVAALKPGNRRWRNLRSDAGCLTAYAYRPEQVSDDVLSQAWSIPADGVIQNVTVFPDGQFGAALAVRTPQPPTASPSVFLQTLPGEQVASFSANMCLPLALPFGQRRGPLPPSLTVPVGPSGVLLGKLANGNRVLLPITDPQESSRVLIAAEDHIHKRIIIRAAAAGERVTIHSMSPARWGCLRMPHVVVTDQARPAPGTTLSVVDGTVSPVPRPNTVIEIVPPHSSVDREGAILIRQTGADTVDVRAFGRQMTVRVDLFRAENRYAAAQPSDETLAVPAMAD